MTFSHMDSIASRSWGEETESENFSYSPMVIRVYSNYCIFNFQSRNSNKKETLLSFIWEFGSRCYWFAYMFVFNFIFIIKYNCMGCIVALLLLLLSSPSVSKLSSSSPPAIFEISRAFNFFQFSEPLLLFVALLLLLLPSIYYNIYIYPPSLVLLIL